MSERMHLWMPTEASLPLYEKLMRIFCQRYDVIVEITDIPYTYYWKTLTTALARGEGPDLFFMHNEHMEELKPYRAPYEFTYLEEKHLKACYPISSDQRYHYDFAYLTSLLYLQKEVCIQATNWKDGIQQLKQQSTCSFDFGCSINLDAAAAFYTMVALQHQEYEAKEKKVSKAWLQHLFQELKVYDPNQDCKRAFLSKEITMVYSWGWFAGYLDDAQITYQVLPLLHEEDSIYYDRRNTKSSCSINMASKHKALANRFVFEFLSDLEMQKLFCLTRKVVPLHRELQKDIDLLQDPVLRAQKMILSHTLFPQKPQSEAEIKIAQQQLRKIYEVK